MMIHPLPPSWVHDEHRQIEDLADGLRKFTAVVPRVVLADWLIELQDKFESFRTKLQHHMEAEEEQGYLMEVTRQRPTLSARVERLKTEHRDLTWLLDELHRLARELLPERRLLVRNFCARIATLLAYVEHHESEEDDLVEMVFLNDLGTKD